MWLKLRSTSLTYPSSRAIRRFVSPFSQPCKALSAVLASASTRPRCVLDSPCLNGGLRTCFCRDGAGLHGRKPCRFSGKLDVKKLLQGQSGGRSAPFAVVSRRYGKQRRNLRTKKRPHFREVQLIRKRLLHRAIEPRNSRPASAHKSGGSAWDCTGAGEGAEFSAIGRTLR